MADFHSWGSSWKGKAQFIEAWGLESRVLNPIIRICPSIINYLPFTMGQTSLSHPMTTVA